ncbi:DUF6075 family protein [Stecheria sp. CLA-KB-P133]|uniref:DUF6075 family protein n=1 Tax=Grylomicrobium aquisgranensis TaxID=2926318 RepID=A0AB35U9S0_9FIRM|nr:DUF6075 family protein [Stecheria sp. CLA-KB-P133]
MANNRPDFVTDAQRDFCSKYSLLAHRNDDWAALIYLLGIDQTCREHAAEIIQGGELQMDSLHAPWQTTGSLATMRLAFNLFGYTVPDGEDPDDYAVKALFSHIDEEHRAAFVQAIYYFA